MESRVLTNDKSKATIIQFDLTNKTAVSCETLNPRYDFNRYIYWIHVDLNNISEAESMLRALSLSLKALDIDPLVEADDFFPFLNETDEAISFQMRCLSDVKLDQKNEAHYSHATVYLTDAYCLTISHDMPCALADFKRDHKKALRYAETPGFIMFLLLDNVINEYLDILLEFERLSDEIDLDFRRIKPATYRKVIATKRRVIKVKRYVAIISDMIMRLSGRKMDVISASCRESLIGLLTHCQMVITEADAIRDAINSSLDSINNALMGRMNETMRLLTVYTLIFMPLTLITGIYGMNFQHMPELSWHYGYFLVLLVMACCASFMIYLFKKRRWI